MERKLTFQKYLNLALISGFSLGIAGMASAQDWGAGGGDEQNTRNAANEHKISVGNVGSLTTKWVFTTQGEVSATPTVKGGLVYAVDWGGYIHCVNASTGIAVWSKALSITPEIGDSGFGGPIRTTSRTSPIIKGDTIYIGDNQFTAVLLWRTIVSHHAFGAVTSTAVTLNVASDEHCNLWQTFRPRATSKIRFGFFTYCDRTIFDHNCPLKKLGLREFGCPISYWPVILL